VADTVDISGMPDPADIGLNPAPAPDPTAGMPEPLDLWRKFHFGNLDMSTVQPGPGTMWNPTKDQLDDFMANPPERPSLRKGVSAASGLPRAAAGYLAMVPAGVASVAGQLTGIPGAVAAAGTGRTDLIPDAFTQANDRGRRWSAAVNNLANYVPATDRGAQTAAALLNVPGQVIQSQVGEPLREALPDNAYQTLAEVAQDVGTDLPALGAPGLVRGAAAALREPPGRHGTPLRRRPPPSRRRSRPRPSRPRSGSPSRATPSAPPRTRSRPRRAPSIVQPRRREPPQCRRRPRPLRQRHPLRRGVLR